MSELSMGRYTVREARDGADVLRAQELRALAFRGLGGRDADAFDARCRHFLIEDRCGGDLVATFRVLPLSSGAEICLSYAAQHYELLSLSSYPDRMVELGRFCLHPAWHDPDILRLAWGAIARLVDAERAEMLFGCSSFVGTDVAPYLDSFAMLRERHIAPRRWLPKVKAPKVFRFGRRLRAWQVDRTLGLLKMPPLLRTYLKMGGWVSDHAVVDSELDTLHVFTALEIGRIPPARARALRLIAG
jgi:L-ornithine Nalpha-acyltransferase